MKLLIVTQVMDTDHPILGFFVRWVLEFATQCESVMVICLQEGKHALPDNVRVYSLGKFENQRVSIVDRARFAAQFKYLIWKHRHEYDTVFVHMNPEYIVLGGVLWRLWRKRIKLWYSHRAVNLKLRIAALLAHDIYSTTPHAMRLSTPKAHFVGHGIDIARWPLLPAPPEHEFVALLYVGRITPIKRIALMIDTVIELRTHGTDARLTLIGAPVTEEDHVYREQLRARIPHFHRDAFFWAGAQPQSALPAYYGQADVLLNFSPDGGMDKTVLEAALCGVPSVVTNVAFREFENSSAPVAVIAESVAESLAKAILQAYALARTMNTRMIRREAVESYASLASLIIRILADPE